MHKFVRIAGGLVGFLEILVGILLLHRYGIESIIRFGGAISLIGIGYVFLYYAFTGKSSLSMSRGVKIVKKIDEPRDK